MRFVNLECAAERYRDQIIIIVLLGETYAKMKELKSMDHETCLQDAPDKS